MKSILATIAATVALGFATSPTFADSTCSAEAKSSCADKDKTACADKDKTACADKDKTACATACAEKEAAMAKGGAATDNVTVGYSLGQRVPNFTLADTTGKEHSLTDFTGNVVVLTFYNQDCPYVVEVKDRMSAFATAYADKGVKVLAVDSGKSDEARLAKQAAYQSEIAFPLLVNSDSSLARSFSATRTPEVFIIDKNGVIAYTGAFDNGEKGAAAGARKAYAEDAVKALLAGEEPEVRQTKAFGCTIKFNSATGWDKKADKADKGEKKGWDKKDKKDKAESAM